jgi:integrase
MLSRGLSQLLVYMEPENTPFRPPYKIPILKTYGDDLTKRWTIEFYIWSAPLQKLVRKQAKIAQRLNAKERFAYADKLMSNIELMLTMGYHLKEANEDITDIIEDIEAVKAYENIMEVKTHLLKKNSITAYRLSAESFCTWLKANYPKIKLGDLTKPLCIGYLDWYQREHGVSNRSRNNRMTFLRTLTNDLEARGFIQFNPWHKIKAERIRTPQNYPFTDYHKQKLIPALKRDLQLWYACQFLYYLFRRPSELNGMKIGQINWQQKQVMIPNTYKSGEVKYPTISQEFEKVIIEMGILGMNPSWYVFGRGGKPGPLPLKDDNLSKRFSKIRDRLGVEKHYVFYCWKHTGNFDSVIAGVNIKAIQAQNGHAKLEDTDHYLRSLGYEHNEQIRAKQPSLG